MRASGQAFNSEYAIIESLKSRLKLSKGGSEDCSGEIQPLLAELVGGDSRALISPSSAAQSRLRGALAKRRRQHMEQPADRCNPAQGRRHGVTASRRLALLRIRVLQAARRHAEAGMLLEEYDLTTAARPSQPSELERSVRLRHALERDGSRAERVRLSALLTHHPALETRQRISLAVLEASARQREGAESVARRHLRFALRESEAQGLVAVLIEDGESLERVLPGFIAAPGPGTRRLAAFAASILKPLAPPSAPLRSKDLAGLSRQEHRVLAYVADGYSNKQTARSLGLSESTVKFHLRSLFKKLAVDSRAALSEAARSRGIVT